MKHKHPVGPQALSVKRIPLQLPQFAVKCSEAAILNPKFSSASLRHFAVPARSSLEVLRISFAPYTDVIICIYTYLSRLRAMCGPSTVRFMRNLGSHAWHA